MTEITLRQGDGEKTIRASRQGGMIRVEMDGKTTTFQLIAQTGAEIVLERSLPDGSRQQWHLAGHKNGSKRTLWLDGRTHQYERALLRGAGGSGQNESLAATIPAVVAEILVSEGDQVSAGAKLILLESMKMIIPILAPHDGLVTALNCRPGESVQAGVQLIELDESGTRKEIKA